MACCDLDLLPRDRAVLAKTDLYPSHLWKRLQMELPRNHPATLLEKAVMATLHFPIDSSPHLADH